MPETIEIPESRSTKWFLFVFVFLLTIFSLWMARTEPLIGYSGAVFGGYMSMLWFKMIMDPRARVTLTNEGIEDRNNGFGVIAWRDIDIVTVQSVQHSEFISIRVYNEDEYLKRLSAWKRRTAKLNRALGFSPITIPIVGLKIKSEELLAMIQKRIG
jgi:hypothetical protein